MKLKKKKEKISLWVSSKNFVGNLLSTLWMSQLSFYKASKRDFILSYFNLSSHLCTHTPFRPRDSNFKFYSKRTSCHNNYEEN